jgi:hypothetical protein
MLRRIRYTQIGVVTGGVVALILSAVGSGQGVNPIYLLIWLVLGNLALMRLKCVRCGKSLSTLPPFMHRAFGLHTCAHCGEKQPP